MKRVGRMLAIFAVMLGTALHPVGAAAGQVSEAEGAEYAYQPVVADDPQPTSRGDNGRLDDNPARSSERTSVASEKAASPLIDSLETRLTAHDDDQVLPVCAEIGSTDGEIIQCADKLLISKLQVGADSGRTSYEFIELYNPANEEVYLDSWQIEYLNGAGTTRRVVAELDDITIGANGYFVIANVEYVEIEADMTYSASNLIFQSGTLKLLKGDKLVDMVGWGSAKEFAGEPAEASNYLPIERCLSADSQLVDTGNNRDDFTVYADQRGILLRDSSLCKQESPGDSPGDEQVNYCDEVGLSEIGANLANQFIEVANYGVESASLAGCQLQTNRNSKSHVFGDIDVLPGSHLVVMVADTELALTKTTKGTVYLMASDGITEVDSQSYQQLKEGTSWARFNDGWRQTYSITPGAENIYAEFKPCDSGYERNVETGRCRLIQNGASGLKPCAPDQERNPDTNRCRKIDSSASQLVPCRPGQERNPATNRCRSTAATSNALVPCKAGQERNPATNRCRSIAGQASTLKPCAPGQERNPETNRCRKVPSSTPEVAGYGVETIADTSSATVGWWAFGGVGALALGYSAWEWRSEIGRLTKRIASFWPSSK